MREYQMLLKTNIPETTKSFASAVDFGDSTFGQEIINDRIDKIQAKMTGNRCGHVPGTPRFFRPPDHHKPRPSTLEKAICQFKDVYRQPKRFLKKLVTVHKNGRQKRSERREAVTSVAQVLLHYLELSTLRVGFYTDPDQFKALDLKYIAQKAGISFLRAQRAIADLVKAGYIKVSRQFNKKEDGSFDGLASIRRIAIQFFMDLGINMQQLAFERDWKRKKEEKQRAKAEKSKLSGLLKAALQLEGNKPITHVVKKQRLQTIDKTKALIDQALTLHQLDPTHSPSDYLKQLQKQHE